MPVDVVLDTLQRLWQALAALGVRAAVMGGIAASAWKHPRSTRDVDLLVDVAAMDPEALLRHLAAAGFRPKREPPVLALGPLRILQPLYETPRAYVEVQVDLLLADSEYHQQALDRRVPLRLPELEVEVSVLSCEDLILLKLLAGRIIDRADVVALIQANRDTLDLSYLLTWADRLGRTDELREAWASAFPEEPTPPAPAR